MYIELFLHKHPKIKLSENVLNLCRVGEDKMNKSVDSLHDDHHIGRLFKNLSNFLKHYPNHHKIDFEVLLLSICWHDTWKARRVTLNPIKLIYYQIYEGIGSMIIFSQNSINILPHKVIKEVNYAIRKHSQFQFLPLETIEAKILKDIDDLDVLSAKRLKPLIKSRHKINFFTKIFGKLYISNYANKNSLTNFEFTWSKKRAKKINKIVNQILLLV